MKVLKITEEQKDLLVGKQFDIDCYFNPILDRNGNWFISLEEREYNTNEEINWLGNLEEIDYEPIVIDLASLGV
jgi:hypothetical protein